MLALQGDFPEHVVMVKRALDKMGVSGEVLEIVGRRALNDLDAIVMPGGESTVVGSLLKRMGMLEVLRDLINEGLPCLGTCAGAVLLAKRVRDRVVGELDQPLMGVMDIGIVRNAFGRQRESFEMEVQVEELGRAMRAAFIRAPAIVEVWGRAREMAKISHGQLGEVTVLAKQDCVIASAFHPEVCGDTSLHEYFLRMVKR